MKQTIKQNLNKLGDDLCSRIYKDFLQIDTKQSKWKASVGKRDGRAIHRRDNSKTKKFISKLSTRVQRKTQENAGCNNNKRPIIFKSNNVRKQKLS